MNLEKKRWVGAVQTPFYAVVATKFWEWLESRQALSQQITKPKRHGSVHSAQHFF
jgi:CO/xanthine dehydrogenase Mo-binding subunit